MELKEKININSHNATDVTQFKFGCCCFCSHFASFSVTIFAIQTELYIKQQ